ncbi:MAG: GyrI-like domain-containing protein [Thermoplasmata archaeon]
MTVDFAFKRSPKYQVATLRWKGPWNEKQIRAKFDTLVSWAKRNHLRVGHWIFREPGNRTWEVCIEIKRRATPTRGIRLKTLAAATVARVVFDPDQVSPRVVYHGLNDWTRARRRDKEIKGVTSAREIYPGDPWRSPAAWKATEIQFVVRK